MKNLREQVVLATELEFAATLSATAYEGTAFTYGVGGLLGDLEELSPGLGMVIAPVELAEFFGNAYITKDATGTSSGWQWRRVRESWCHQHGRSRQPSGRARFLLGYATMTMWLDAESPWAARTVDVAISSSEASRPLVRHGSSEALTPCCPRENSSSITPSSEPRFRGIKAVELGKTYDNRPQGTTSTPTATSWWGGAWTAHLPDNSTARSHPLDEAMTCISEVQRGGVRGC